MQRGVTTGQPQNPFMPTTSGPQFDANYLNNLSVFESGTMSRPVGGLYINPTAKNPFDKVGTPVTGGNAPLYGPTPSLLDVAQADYTTGLTANPFASTSSTPYSSSSVRSNTNSSGYPSGYGSPHYRGY